MFVCERERKTEREREEEEDAPVSQLLLCVKFGLKTPERSVLVRLGCISFKCNHRKGSSGRRFEAVERFEERNKARVRLNTRHRSGVNKYDGGS